MAVLRRVKVKAGHYDMVALDDYPWDWYLADGWTNYQGRTTGTTDSLANAVDIVQHLWVAGHIERE
jgi:hypothetical protein